MGLRFGVYQHHTTTLYYYILKNMQKVNTWDPARWSFCLPVPLVYSWISPWPSGNWHRPTLPRDRPSWWSLWFSCCEGLPFFVVIHTLITSKEIAVSRLRRLWKSVHSSSLNNTHSNDSTTGSIVMNANQWYQIILKSHGRKRGHQPCCLGGPQLRQWDVLQRLTLFSRIKTTLTSASVIYPM